MKKKLQVFASSTFTDLIDERQAAVEAILSAGHIPAGMELFKAGDESQKETIKKWIDESDVYVLILGGRYGSIEPKSGKSYTHWEYEYAEEKKIPRFSVVINREALEAKTKELGSSVLEIDNPLMYKEFKKEVLQRSSEFFNDVKDIKLTIHRKLADLASNDSLSGWVSAKDIESNEVLIDNFMTLLEENTLLKKENEALLNNAEKNKNTNSEVIPINGLKGKISSRIERILKILNAEEQETYSSNLEWYHEDGEENVQVILPQIPTDFTAYFRYSTDGSEDIEELLLVGIVDLVTEFNELLADIRVMLTEHKNKVPKNSLVIKFIIAIKGEHPQRIVQSQKFFKEALIASEIENQSHYILEIWDESKLESIEKELVLAL